MLSGAGLAERAPSVAIVWVVPRGACVQTKPPFHQKPLEPHYKAIHYMSNTGTSQRGRNNMRRGREKRSPSSPSPFWSFY